LAHSPTAPNEQNRALPWLNNNSANYKKNFYRYVISKQEGSEKVKKESYATVPLIQV
jgi:hypothetical protein